MKETEKKLKALLEQVSSTPQEEKTFLSTPNKELLNKVDSPPSDLHPFLARYFPSPPPFSDSTPDASTKNPKATLTTQSISSIPISSLPRGDMNRMWSRNMKESDPDRPWIDDLFIIRMTLNIPAADIAKLVNRSKSAISSYVAGVRPPRRIRALLHLIRRYVQYGHTYEQISQQLNALLRKRQHPLLRSRQRASEAAREN